MPAAPPTNASLLALVNAGQVVLYRGRLLFKPSDVPSDSQIQTDYGNDVIAQGAGLLFSQKTVQSGDTVANTTAETAFATTYTIPAAILHIGQTVRAKAYGVFGTTATPTLRIKTKLGSTVILDSGAFTTGSGVANGGWEFECIFTAIAVGPSGQIEVQGHSSFNSGSGAANFVNLANTSPVTIDTTQPQVLSQTVTWGTASASNTITRRIATVETIG